MPTAAVSPSRAEQQRRSRQRLMEVARRVFDERGFLAATLDEIAGGAGLTRTAVYKHFADKEDLYLHIVEAEVALQLDEVEPWAGPGLTDELRLQAFLQWYAQIAARGRTAIRAATEFTVVASARPDLRERMTALSTSSMADAERLVRTLCDGLGVPPPMPLPDFALVVLTLANGLLLRAVTDHDFDPTPVFGSAMVVLLGGSDVVLPAAELTR